MMKSWKRGLALLTSTALIGTVCVGLSLNTVDSSVAEKPDGDMVLSKSGISLGLGEVYQLSANDEIEEWDSSRDDLVEINKGEICAKALGASMVGALAGDGDEAQCLVVVRNAPNEVRLSESELTLGVGESYKLKAILPDGTAAATRTFSVDNSDILRMTQTDWEGEFTALKPGKAVVTVRLYNGKEAKCTVTVKAQPEKISLSKNELTLGIGEEYKLSALMSEGSGSREISFTSDSDNIGISTSGNTVSVKAVSEGTAVLTASVYNGKKDICKITVKKAPEKVKMTKSELTVKVGESAVLGCTVNDGAASVGRTYSCDNSDVIKMTRTQWLAGFKAEKPGTAVITVKTYNGKTDTCTVKVISDEPQQTAQTRINNNLNTVRQISSVQNNSEQQTDENTQQSEIKDNTSFSSESDNSTYTPIETVTVLGDYIDLSSNTAVMNPGDTCKISQTSSFSGKLLYSSLDEGVATVDENGNIYAVDYGSTDIIVTDEAGAVGKFEVIVTTGSGMDYSDIYNIEALLNTVELKPMKTNYAPVDEMVDQIFAQILTDDMTPGQKLKACYDYLATQCTYGYDGYKAVSVDGYMSEQDREIVEFSYCILKDRIGTCENFGAAFTVMTRRIGFETNFVYGDVAMSAGGYDGHYWSDVNVNGKHYVFDPQVENNNGASSGNVNYWFYGLRPEYSYGMYRYDYIETVHGFKRW